MNESFGLRQPAAFAERALPVARPDLLPVAGVAPLSTVDYPHRLALVVFTQGCPWRCGYCHNAALRDPSAPAAWSWTQVGELLERRRGCVEAVVFSGGEPTMHAGLERALEAVRARGFLTGLHTAGMFPDRLRAALPLLDWVGLDIKAPFDARYAQLTGDNLSAIHARASLDLLMASGIAYQLRTTVPAGAAGDAAFEAVRRQLHWLGAPEPVRQDGRL